MVFDISDLFATILTVSYSRWVLDIHNGCLAHIVTSALVYGAESKSEHITYAIRRKFYRELEQLAKDIRFEDAKLGETLLKTVLALLNPSHSLQAEDTESIVPIDRIIQQTIYYLRYPENRPAADDNPYSIIGYLLAKTIDRVIQESDIKIDKDKVIKKLKEFTNSEKIKAFCNKLYFAKIFKKFMSGFNQLVNILKAVVEDKGLYPINLTELYHKLSRKFDNPKAAEAIVFFIYNLLLVIEQDLKQSAIIRDIRVALHKQDFNRIKQIIESAEKGELRKQLYERYIKALSTIIAIIENDLPKCKNGTRKECKAIEDKLCNVIRQIIKHKRLYLDFCSALDLVVASVKYTPTGGDAVYKRLSKQLIQIHGDIFLIYKDEKQEGAIENLTTINFQVAQSINDVRDILLRYEKLQGFKSKTKKFLLASIAAYVLYGIIIAKQRNRPILQTLLSPRFIISQAFKDVFLFHIDAEKKLREHSKAALVIRIIAATTLLVLLLTTTYNAVIWFILKLMVNRSISKYLRKYKIYKI